MANEYKRLSEENLNKLTRAVFGLLPSGALFNLDERSNLFKFVKYIADNARGDLTYTSDKLMDELNPDRTTILLDDWIEAAFAFDSGEECITRDELSALNDEEKRRILIARLLENGRVDRDYIERILNLWANRNDIRVYEFFPSRLDVMKAGDTINENTWIFADTGKLRIGETFNFEDRFLPEWMNDYYIYGFATLADTEYGVWSNVEEWRNLPPIFTGANWEPDTKSFRLDGKNQFNRGGRDDVTFPRELQDRYGSGNGVIVAANVYSTVSSDDHFLNNRGALSWYIRENEEKYQFVSHNAPITPSEDYFVNREVWEAVMMYGATNNGRAAAFYLNGEEVLERLRSSGVIAGISGDINIGTSGGRNGPLYVRECYMLIEREDRNYTYEQWLERRRKVAAEVSNPTREYDTFLDTPFYLSGFELIDGDTDPEDEKIFDLIKCILKRILPLSVDYSAGKAK